MTSAFLIAHILDVILLLGALTYASVADGKPNYASFREERWYLLLFKLMLFFALALYGGIAYVGGMSTAFFCVYLMYIASLLAWEEYAYTNKKQYKVHFIDLLFIEGVRETILVVGGFWTF